MGLNARNRTNEFSKRYIEFVISSGLSIQSLGVAQSLYKGLVSKRLTCERKASRKKTLNQSLDCYVICKSSTK